MFLGSKFSRAGDRGLQTPENSMLCEEIELPAIVKKTPLRELQNEQRIGMSTGIENPLFPEDNACTADTGKVETGNKRPIATCTMTPACIPSSSTGPTNGHLVYVRRKLEGDMAKYEAGKTDDENSNRPQIDESNVSCCPEATPMLRPFMCTAAKPFVPLPVGMPGVLITQEECRYDKMDWEERFDQLQILLEKLDESDGQDYVQMFRSLSAVDLSRLAVELEKRSIQLSLEEAKEMQRAAAMNVLGKSVDNVRPS